MCIILSNLSLDFVKILKHRDAWWNLIMWLAGSNELFSLNGFDWLFWKYNQDCDWLILIRFIYNHECDWLIFVKYK